MAVEERAYLASAEKGLESDIFPGLGMGFPLAFAWPCFWRIVTDLARKMKSSKLTAAAHPAARQ